MSTPAGLDLDLQLARGAFRLAFALRSDARAIALVGPSGAGKTSVLQAVAGLLRPVDGHVGVDGDVLFDRARGVDLPAWRRRIGYVFQDGRLFPHLDVRANLRFARAPAASGHRFDFDAVVALLGLEALLHRAPATLSGGEAQRVAIGRALLAQPRLLLLDEPLSMLDVDRRAELLAYLQRVRDLGRVPLVLVSHQPGEVERLADEVHRLPGRADAA